MKSRLLSGAATLAAVTALCVSCRTSGTKATTTDAGPDACTTAGGTNLEETVCEANAFLATLTDTQRASVNLALTDSVARTDWSNLPGLTRAGLKLSDLSADSQQAALTLMATTLTEGGYSNIVGIRAADDYLNSVQTSQGTTGGAPDGGMGGPPGGDGGVAGPPAGDGGINLNGAYGSGNYSIALFGTPSTTGSWSIAFGGHHMAFNVNYVGGVGYPTPNHLGVEPKAEFTIDGGTYQPLQNESDAFFSVFSGMTSDEKTSTHIAGTYSDVVVGPLEYNTGSLASVQAAYPTGTSNRGVFVASLDAATQGAVINAIEAWVEQFDPSYADDLLAAYTSTDALAQTYVAWGGTEAVTDGPDRDVNGTYLRIDGPRLWLELACQQGVVLTAYTHYHTIYRDKQYDYGGGL